MIHDKIADMTVPRFSGAASPHTTNAAMTNAEPQNTAGSMLLKVPFMYCLSSTRGGGVARPNYVSFVRTGRQLIDKPAGRRRRLPIADRDGGLVG